MNEAAFQPAPLPMAEMVLSEKTQERKPEMIKDRRYTGNIIHIDFYAKETFQNYPAKDSLTLTLATDGEWEFTLNGKEYTMSEPFLLCLNESDELRIRRTGNYAAKTFCFRPTFINSRLTPGAVISNTFENTEDMHDRNLIDIFMKRNEYYRGLLKLDTPSMMQVNSWLSVIGAECLSQSDGRWTCRIRRYLLQILYLLEDEFLLCFENKSLQKRPIDYALEYIHSNYHLGLTLEGISRYTGTNRTTLNNMCRQETGMTLMQYLSHYRIKMAKEALRHTNLKLSEISLCCGYNYESYFVRKFTESCGMSPGEYRKKHRG